MATATQVKLSPKARAILRDCARAAGISVDKLRSPEDDEREMPHIKDARSRAAVQLATDEKMPYGDIQEVIHCGSRFIERALENADMSPVIEVAADEALDDAPQNASAGQTPVDLKKLLDEAAETIFALAKHERGPGKAIANKAKVNRAKAFIAKYVLGMTQMELFAYLGVERVTLASYLQIGKYDYVHDDTFHKQVVEACERIGKPPPIFDDNEFA